MPDERDLELELGGVGQARKKALDELVERLDGAIERQSARLLAECDFEQDRRLLKNWGES